MAKNSGDPTTAAAPDAATVTSPDLSKPGNDLNTMPLPQTSQAEVYGVWEKIYNTVAEELKGSSKEKIKEEAQKRFSVFLMDTGKNYAIKELGDKGGKAFGKILEDIQKNQNKLAEDQVALLSNAYIKMLALQDKAANDYVERWNSTQKDGLEAMKSPYQMQASMGGLMSGFGVILMMFPGQQDLAKEMIQKGTAISLYAGQKIMDLEKEVKLLPKEKLDEVEFVKKYSPTDLRAALNGTGSALDSGFLSRQQHRAYNSADGVNVADNDRGTDGNFVKAYSAKAVASKVAMIKGASKFDPLFRAAERLYGLPEGDLKTVAVAESALDPNATGIQTKYGKAKGLMQFIDSTAQANGVQNAYDPVQAIFGGARYRASLYAKYGTSEAVDSHYYGMPGGKPTPDTLAYVANLKTLREKSGGVAVLEAPKGSIKTVSDDDLAEAKKSFTVAAVKPEKRADAGNLNPEANRAFALAEQPRPNGSDTRDVKQVAGVEMTATEQQASDPKKKVVINDPVYRLASNGPGGGLAG